MPPLEYAAHSHHLEDEDQEADHSPPRLSPSRLEPYSLLSFAARQTSSALNQDGQFTSLISQSNRPHYRGPSNQYLAPTATLGFQHRYDDAPYFNFSECHLQPAFQSPDTPQVVVSGPSSYYEGNGMSPSNATDTLTGTIGSGTHLLDGSAHLSNSINNQSPRSQNYGLNLQASDADLRNLQQHPQQYSDRGSSFGHNQAHQQAPLPVSSNSSKATKLPCTCETGFHETKSQRKKCIARQVKPAKCPYLGCGYASATKNDLDRHVTCKHSNDVKKKHICPFCHRNPISRIDNYKNHLENVHHINGEVLLEYVKQSKQLVKVYCDSLPRDIPQLHRDDCSNYSQMEHEPDTSAQDTAIYDAHDSCNSTSAASDMDTSFTDSWMGNGQYNMDTVNRPAQSLDGDADLMDEDTSSLQYCSDSFGSYPMLENGYQVATETLLQSESNMAQAPGLSNSQGQEYINYQTASRPPSAVHSMDNGESAIMPVWSSQPSAADSRLSMGYTQPTSAHSSGYFDASLSRTTSREENFQPAMHRRGSSSITVPLMSATKPALRQVITGPARNDPNLAGQNADRELSHALEVLAAHGLVATPRGQTVEPTSVSPLSAKENSRHAEEEDPSCNTCQTLRRKNKMSELRKHLIRVNKLYFCTWQRCSKRCGSKDEQKKHANSQHYNVEGYKCGRHHNQPPYQVCKYHSYHRHAFINHLNDKHADALSQGRTAADTVKDRIKNKCFPREMWCGHCRRWCKLVGNDKEIWDGWWNHVEDHLFGRKEELQQKAEDWVREEGAKPQRMMTLDCASQDQSQLRMQRQSSIPQPGVEMNLAFRSGHVAASPAIEALRKPKRRATSSPERRPSNKKTGLSGSSRARPSAVCCRCGFVMSAEICVNTTNCQHQRCMDCHTDDVPSCEVRDDDDD